MTQKEDSNARGSQLERQGSLLHFMSGGITRLDSTVFPGLRDRWARRCPATARFLDYMQPVRNIRPFLTFGERVQHKYNKHHSRDKTIQHEINK